MKRAKNKIERHVLVLNRLWQAVNVCTAGRSISLLYIGHAQVILEEDNVFQTLDFELWRERSQDYDGEDCVHTPNYGLQIPQVILLRYYDRLPHKDVKFTRHNIYERDKNTCQYCGKRFKKDDLNIDHVVPRDAGGSTGWDNVVCACVPCNSHKANRTPHQAGMKLMRKPKRPKWRPFVNMNMKDVSQPSWDKFIDIALWDDNVTVTGRP